MSESRAPSNRNAWASSSESALNDYIGTRKELLEAADTLFAAVIGGTLRVMINHAYALKDAAKAYAELESRVMTGRRS